LPARGDSAQGDWDAGNKAIATPDLRGRSPVGLDTMGTAAANRLTGIAFAGGSAAVVGGFGGFSTIALAETHIPSHTHTGGGTTSGDSNNHTHSGQTAGFNANHQHLIDGWTDAGGGTHEHTYDRTDGSGPKWIQGGASSARESVAHSTYGGGAHQHHMSFWSGWANTDHSHAFTTGGVSEVHTHSYSFTTTAYGGSAAHENVPPFYLVTWYLKL
jgi:hypothetical protein